MSTAPAGHRIIADVPCRKCGYNLRTLHTDGRCPECNASAWPSLTVPPELGKAYGPWLKRVRCGAWFLAIAWLLAGGTSVITFYVLAPEGVLQVLVAVAMLLVVAGGVLFSRPEPFTGTLDDSYATRPAIWASAVLAAVGVFVVLLTGDLLACIATTAALFVNQSATVLHASRLAERTQARFLASLGIPAIAVLAFLWIGAWLGPMLVSMLLLLPVLTIACSVPAVVLSWFLIRAPRVGRPDSTPWTQTLTAPDTTQEMPARP